MQTLRNSVQLTGHAGIDPEVKTIGKDRKMARFTLATNDYYTNEKGERKEDTQWHRLVAWGKTAEIVEKLVKKGQQVAISGKLTHNNWEDKDGKKRHTMEIVINELLAVK
ncbi:MAG: single-stranded DNA-binding protein [Bacteroidetes bacterium HGW-Bacteroidetes-1]|jgi:single-strand DNA-binding protein|nr:MAG: single-stranded DNA-binding protein [Bacteroidetes bacterium HGW-Bacteroidetes-1]